MFFCSDFSDKEVEVFTKFTNHFDAAVKNMLKTSSEQTQKCQTHYKREFQTIGKAFCQLGNALEQDGNYRKQKKPKIISTNLPKYYVLAYRKLQPDQRHHVHRRGLRGDR